MNTTHTHTHTHTQIGPGDRRLAAVSLAGLKHVQRNDIEKGVPIRFEFQLKFFEIKSLLADPWNKQYQQVLGPLGEDKEEVTAASWLSQDTAMLSVLTHRLPTKVGEQTIFTSLWVEIYPLRMQLTEDLRDSLYYFAFPGTWAQTQWVDAKFNEVPSHAEGERDPKKQSLVALEQKRQFYRLPYTCHMPRQAQDMRPCDVRHRVASAASSRPVPGAAEGERLKQRDEKQRDDMERLIQRVRDNFEFKQVHVSAVSAADTHDQLDDKLGSLDVSLSYKGRKGAFPDIDAMVIGVPNVTLPKESDGAMVCSWKELFDTWLAEVKWPIIQQATSNWNKVCPPPRCYQQLQQGRSPVCPCLCLSVPDCACLCLSHCGADTRSARVYAYMYVCVCARARARATYIHICIHTASSGPPGQ